MRAHVVALRTFWAVEIVFTSHVSLALHAFDSAVAERIGHILHLMVVLAVKFDISAPFFRDRRRLLMLTRPWLLHGGIQVIGCQIVQSSPESPVHALEFLKRSIKLES